MSPIDQADVVETTQKSPEQPKKNWILKAVAVSATLLSTQVQANDLLAQCDWIDRAWVIHQDKKNWKINGFPEKLCVKKIKIAQWKERVAQWKERVAQWKIVLAQLDMTLENLKKELREVEAELSKNKAELSKNKAELERKRKWLKEKLEQIIKNSVNIS